jgi:alkylation response protein AidB-like acyl-CoA dehydrogenase
MQTYTPPLRDMRFVLHELHDSSALAKLPGLEEMTPDLLNTILEEAGKFISATLLPLNASGDAEGCRYEDGVVRTPKGFKEAYKAYCDAGWGALSAPVKFGGAGHTAAAFAKHRNRLSAFACTTSIPARRFSRTSSMSSTASDSTSHRMGRRCTSRNTRNRSSGVN